LFIGRLITRAKNNEVQYIDDDEKKELKPKLQIGSNWCKYSEGEVYIFSDQYYLDKYLPLLERKHVKFMVKLIG